MKSATLQTLSKRWQDAQGFTLLEVLIAISIMATILVILFGTYSAAVDRAARSRELSQIYHEARVLLQLLANDLRSSYVKARSSVSDPRARPRSPRHDRGVAGATR